MGEDDSFMDKKKPHKARHSGKLEDLSKSIEKYQNFAK
jgi:hypothetical protein